MSMSQPINILLVDDEQRNLDALEAILDDPSYRLLRADQADKALRLLLDHDDVAAMVLDIKMPVVSGFELAKMIKGTKKFRQIPIVFLTAHLLDDQDILTGYGAGAVDYLTKPVNPDILRHKIATFAELYRKTRALAELNETLETRVRERTIELKRSEEALSAASEQKDLFLATLAHELRNPLAPLRTGLDILLRQPDQTEVSARTIAAMNRQLSHMVRLIDDLLDVSRISRGKLEMRRELIDLSTVIDTAIETARPMLERRNQVVEVRAECAVSAFVDPTRIAQVIGNLLNNASKHSESGARVLLELARKGDMAIVRVVDEGIGIPSEQMSRVFTMFTKIERAIPGTNDGLGIGLALSRRLAEQHGGALSVDSDGEGKGAVFTLTIPTGAAGGQDAAPPVESAPSAAAVAVLRVVVVEDNEDAADLLSAWLERLGCNVQVARTGPDGLAVVLESKPDVVLCDLGLPGIDGVELCRRVVGSSDTPPVMVALTGWGMESDRQRTLEAGFQHHLVKPVAMDQLLRVLQTVRAAVRAV
jgi:signal transduction histidine kinase